MPLQNEDIRKVTESVWSAMLGVNLISTDGAPRLAKQGFLTGCVYIVGGWEGLTTIQCSERLARKAASIMFGCDEPQAEEIRDALGELVNMTGGNIKSLLPGPCELSLLSSSKGKTIT
jgi:chemotaxis protein CheX